MTDEQIFAILYAAKSTEDPRGSVARQLAEARAWAEENGWIVVAEYDDIKASGYSADRGEKLALAQAHAEQLAAEYGPGRVMLVVQHSDRFARGDGKKA